MTSEWDVVVAGAGPAGAASAALLARRGFRVLLVDQAHFPRPKACAEYMSPGVTQVLARCDLIAEVRNLRAHQVPGMDIRTPEGVSLRVAYRLESESLVACTIPRTDFDAALVQEAVRAGAELAEGFRVRCLLFRDGAVCGVEGTSGNGDRSLRSRLTVIADGNRSTLARSLGLSSPPRWPVRLGLVAHFRGTGGLTDGYGQMHVGAGGYCGVAPLADDLLNVAMVVPMGAVKATSVSSTAFFDNWVASHAQLRNTLAGCERVTPVRGVGPIGSRSRCAWFPGGLLVGDAASFFDPFTGEGIYRALRGAELVSEVATAALEMGASLAAYDQLRASAFRRKEAVTALVQLFVQYPRLMEYAAARLAGRRNPRDTLGLVLGDVVDAREFLRPRMLWSALHP